MFYLALGLTIAVLIATAIVFYNTIITRKWRDKAPDESKSWKLFFIYYNPLDNRWLLPKRTGLGFTFNFAHPGAQAATIIILLIVILTMVLNI